MDLEKRVALLEKNFEFLTVENQRRHTMIMAAAEQIDLLHATVEQMKRQNGAEHEKMQDRHKVAEDIQDIIGEKLYQIFYKVFPEAIEADKALDRAMASQKKKPAK
jgi:hypothetical protein